LFVVTRKLEAYSIVPRYPDLMDDLTIEDARQAYSNAIAIKNFVLKHFFE
jgi:predicted AAA+ superfamily ATPase